MNSLILELNLHGCKSKKRKKKKIKSEKKFQSWKNLKHCIYFETLYLFWGIVFILRHYIYFQTLYLFPDIIFISRHCIYFETLYFFWDIVFFSRPRDFSLFESAQSTLTFLSLCIRAPSFKLLSLRVVRSERKKVTVFTRYF